MSGIDVERFAEDNDESLAELGYDRSKGWFLARRIA